jgi:RNA-directed DNA polymerase
VAALDNAVMTKSINYIVEVDIKGFFDNVQHSWLQRCLEERISDPNLLWLVRRFLKAGAIEEGKHIPTDMGTPQGGVVSPPLANIYTQSV